MTPEQQTAWAQIVDLYRTGAPAGWVRIVGRWECALDAAGTPSRSGFQVAIVRAGDELVQQSMTKPQGSSFIFGDLHHELAQATESGSLTIDFRIDADGTDDLTLTEEPAKVLAGVRDDETLGHVRHHLKRNRSELEELAGRVRS